LGSGVSINLLGNSFIGQNAFTDGPNGTDSGRTAELSTGVSSDVNNSSNLTDTARGAILEIKGNISGVGGLTKQSIDTVIISGSNTMPVAPTSPTAPSASAPPPPCLTAPMSPRLLAASLTSVAGTPPSATSPPH
jgi:hypothetical protein